MISLASLALAHVLAQIPMGGITGGTAAPPWTHIQSKYFDSVGTGSGSNCANTGATCTVNVSSVTAGHILIVYGLNNASSSISLSSVSGETWTDCSSCKTTNTSFGQIDMMYVLSATGGETSFTCTFTSASNAYQACGFVELAHSGTTSFDTGGVVTNASCSSCSGVGLTLGGTSDAIIQIEFGLQGGTTGVSSPYTLPANTAHAYLLNTSSGTAPTWSFASSGAFAGSGIAISGAAASGITLNTHSSGTTSSSNTTVSTGSISGTGANLIVVAYTYQTGATHTLSDSSSNSYTNVILNQAGDITLAVSYVCNPTVTGSMTFTITASAGDLMSIAAATFKNTACPSSYTTETDNLCCTSSGGTFQPGSITATNGALLVSAVGATSSTSDTVNSSFNVIEFQGYNGGNTSVSLAYLVTSSSGAVNPTWTVGTQSDLAGGGVGMAEFK